MVNAFVTKKEIPNISMSPQKLLSVLVGVFLFIVALTIFQDFLESKRSGYAFYFKESLLFKTVWFLFIPILAVLFKKLKNEIPASYRKTAAFTAIAIAAHLFILPFVAVVFSILFYEGRYDLYKFFSYTIANDLDKLVIVYAGFALGHKYLENRTRKIDPSESKPATDTIIVHNGRDNVVVNVEDITQITSATPYTCIHVGNKKYLHSETLKSICEQLDRSVFIRVHKSTAVNITKVNSFKSRLNGDYDLRLTNGELVRLSRTYAANFKNHFKRKSSG